MNIERFFWAFRYPVLVFAVNEFLGPVYVRWSWFDIPMHLLGGVVVALAARELLGLWKEKDMHDLVRAFFIIGFVALVAIGWEWYEFLLMAALNAQPNTLQDTLADFAFGIAGAIIVVVWDRFRAI